MLIQVFHLAECPIVTNWKFQQDFSTDYGGINVLCALMCCVNSKCRIDMKEVKSSLKNLVFQSFL
jgi:hypothetical protein